MFNKSFNYKGRLYRARVLKFSGLLEMWKVDIHSIFQLNICKIMRTTQHYTHYMYLVYWLKYSMCIAVTSKIIICANHDSMCIKVTGQISENMVKIYEKFHVISIAGAIGFLPCIVSVCRQG